MGKKRIKTSEGIVTTRKVEYTLEGWVDNFEHYLRTSMSYCGADELSTYTGLCNTKLITYNALKRFSK